MGFRKAADPAVWTWRKIHAVNLSLAASGRLAFSSEAEAEEAREAKAVREAAAEAAVTAEEETAAGAKAVTAEVTAAGARAAAGLLLVTIEATAGVMAAAAAPGHARARMIARIPPQRAGKNWALKRASDPTTTK